MVFTIWVVGAAVLVEAGTNLHYKEIAERVKHSGLAKLGDNGVTPAQSMGKIMRDYDNIFTMLGDGYYGLVDSEAVQNNWEIASAVARLRKMR